MPSTSLQAAGECCETSQLASLQGRLRPFAEHPVVSLGVLKWIHAQVWFDWVFAMALYRSPAARLGQKAETMSSIFGQDDATSLVSSSYMAHHQILINSQTTSTYHTLRRRRS